MIMCLWEPGVVRGWEPDSGVARAFPGGRVAHPEGQNEEENEQSEEKQEKLIAIWGNMRKMELLPTRDCEAGYITALEPDYTVEPDICQTFH